MPNGRRGDDLTDEERCTWVKASSTRCAQPRTQAGVTIYCRWHEDAVAKRVEYWNRAEHVPDMSLDQHMMYQLKTAWVMVRELEFQVLDVGLSVEAWRIETEETEERTGADAKNEYMSSKRAQLHGAHPVIVQYLREREHYMKSIQVCVGAGLAMKQIAIVERYVDTLVTSQMSLAEELGHDPNAPETRRAIMEVVRKAQADLSDLMPKESPPAIGGAA